MDTKANRLGCDRVREYGEGGCDDDIEDDAGNDESHQALEAGFEADSKATDEEYEQTDNREDESHLNLLGRGVVDLHINTCKSCVFRHKRALHVYAFFSAPHHPQHFIHIYYYYYPYNYY